MSTEDPWDDPEWRAFADAFISTGLPMIEDSSITCTIAPRSDSEIDVKYLLELGAMVWLDKPLVVIARHNDDISAKLRTVADLVLIVDLANKEDMRRVRDELAAFAARQHRED